MHQRAADWHRKHRMPVKPTLDQRVRWHLAHARACGCRPIPRSVLTELRARRIVVPGRVLGVLVALGSLVGALDAKAQAGNRGAEAEVAALVATYDSAWLLLAGRGLHRRSAARPGSVRAEPGSS